MKKMLIAAVCLMLLSPAHAGASLFGSDGPKDTDEITPLKDGKITVGECKAIEKAAGNVAPAFYAAAKAPRLQDSISETMDKAKKDGKELGSKLEDTLNNQLPQLFDDAMNLFRDQMRQYNKEKPEAPTNL